VVEGHQRAGCRRQADGQGPYRRSYRGHHSLLSTDLFDRIVLAIAVAIAVLSDPPQDPVTKLG
jgi:hypothetical protein